jgi:hypothetical protein
MEALLDVVESILPFDEHEWEEVEQNFIYYAKQKGRSERTLRALKDRFELLCNGPNTGAGGPSERQKRAREIHERILQTQGAGILIDLPQDDERNLEEIILDEGGLEENGFEEGSNEIQQRVEGLTTKREAMCGEIAKKRILAGFSGEKPTQRRRVNSNENILSQFDFISFWMLKEEKRDKEREEKREREEKEKEEKREREEKEKEEKREREEKEKKEKAKKKKKKEEKWEMERKERELQREHELKLKEIELQILKEKNKEKAMEIKK